MKKINSILVFAILIFTLACSMDDDISNSEVDGLSSRSSGNGQNEQAGLITAGEWNDLDNWSFWNDLLNNQEYSDKPGYWSFFTNNRISVLVADNASNPIIDAKVELKINENLIWEAKTDNIGKAELWFGLFQETSSIDVNEFEIYVNDELLMNSITLYEDGINEVIINTNPSSSNKVEISFIVDATGSMADELEFLKIDLEDVIQRVNNNNSNINILTSAVFYRDEGDQYVTRLSNFSNDISTTLDFIRQQNANGGGDFPEAVHTALNKAVNELQWSDIAKTRIAFLLLDAPPHYDQQIIDDLQYSIMNAAKKGIKIIPITASGINKETEFLMRFFSISTNGTYVFITNDSGIGNDHLEASVGDYQVEFLNDLMVRLINKYVE